MNIVISEDQRDVLKMPFSSIAPLVRSVTPNHFLGNIDIKHFSFVIPYAHALINLTTLYIDGLVQESHNSIAIALELRLSCTNPLICYRAYFVYILKKNHAFVFISAYSVGACAGVVACWPSACVWCDHG